jgi:SRSO17 transposase
MAGTRLDWTDELGRWLAPFLARLGHKARRRMCPLYIAGLIGPGDRKSVQPMRSASRRAITISCIICGCLSGSATLERNCSQADHCGQQRCSAGDR